MKAEPDFVLTQRVQEIIVGCRCGKSSRLRVDVVPEMVDVDLMNAERLTVGKSVPLRPGPITIVREPEHPTRRDRFAMAALTGITGTTMPSTTPNADALYLPANVARASYELADAMLAEREKTR